MTTTRDWSSMTEAEIESALEDAGRVAERKALAIYEEHAARHGTTMIVVGRRAGYKGERVCPRCYYSR